MTRGKLKLKKRNLDQKRNRKEIGKEIQRLEREHEERQAAEIAHITQRNQAQKARDAAAATMQDEISDAGEGTHGGNQAAPQFPSATCSQKTTTTCSEAMTKIYDPPGFGLRCWPL